ncbi:MAG: Crp/Fnr family transcriptional regulator [Candidatus Marinimicrobia bacterium]|nr:Crp/Fnr family transcriptional regulator [Candidatus Neomarinimicrobiota bacterium]MCF7850665.1 Crp/Fnr family transcriptional regulator [Candidatus Neomarinimicrobiota bacterium]MCF7904468.1 Crp/Fnr family transcriptional regulator [Candidatus Neomarinimicrobiota bacterium]
MAEKTKIWYLQNFNLLAGMNQNIKMELAEKTTDQASAKKDIIYFPEEPSNTIYFLKEGKIKIYRLSEDGKTTTLHLLGPGEIFGESAILGQDTHDNVAEVVEDAVICAVDKHDFQDLMEKSPQLAISVNKFIGFRLRKIQSHVEDLVFKSAKDRILAFLHRYVSTFGKQMVDGWMVRPFLTHKEIADLTATARQTVNQVLNELADDGVISFSRRFLHIKGDLNQFQ